jgi:hypothetical protein
LRKFLRGGLKQRGGFGSRAEKSLYIFIIPYMFDISIFGAENGQKKLLKIKILADNNRKLLIYYSIQKQGVSSIFGYTRKG